MAAATEEANASTSEQLADKMEARCVSQQRASSTAAAAAAAAVCAPAFCRCRFACAQHTHPFTCNPFQPNKILSSLSLEGVEPELAERFRVCRSVAEECVTDADLLALLRHKPNPIAYDGFEPSGRMHIAQGVLKAINVNKLTSAGCTFKFWVADWFAQLNNKMGGDLKKIQTIGRYMVEVWKAVGMDMARVEFLNCSEEINARCGRFCCGGYGWVVVVGWWLRRAFVRVCWPCCVARGRGRRTNQRPRINQHTPHHTTHTAARIQLGRVLVARHGHRAPQQPQARRALLADHG
jgi:hypothetical protein